MAYRDATVVAMTCPDISVVAAAHHNTFVVAVAYLYISVVASTDIKLVLAVEESDIADTEYVIDRDSFADVVQFFALFE